MATVTATPMRQVPGAYLNTPAAGRRADPVRRKLFDDLPRAASATTTGYPRGRDGADLPPSAQQLPQPPPAEATASLPPILKAARSVNQVLQQDESYPDLDSYCRPGASSEYSVQALESSWAPFQKTNVYPIPDTIFQQYNLGNISTRMGLFAEINHAWACVDNALFLWDYTHPNPELIGFEDQPHGIRAVALVPPKPGVFIAAITHILVVATTADILLLGVAASTTPTGAHTLSLYQTKMSLHRGSSDVSLIVGTATGRIFVGGDGDIDISEVYYQQEERWFSSRCGKINHTHPGWSSVVPVLPTHLWGPSEAEHLVDMVVDDTRNLLYTLSNKSTIRTYHMEAPDKLRKLIEKERNHCLRDIAHMINTSPLLTERMSIVSISPIPAQEASKLHLMALTSTGCRLFLSATSSASYLVGPSSDLAPQSMQVQFVKFPPPEQAAPARVPVRPGEPSDLPDLRSRALDASRFGQRFSPGYFFASVSKEADPNTDLVFVSAPETGRIKGSSPASTLKYYEHGNWLDLGERNRVLAVGRTTKAFAAARQPLGFGNELAVQFDQPPSEFAVMTSDGVHVVRRRRLVDIFATAVRNAAGDDGLDRETRRFIQLYGRVETISAALAVACGQGSDLRAATGRAADHTTQDLARAAFVNFGGQPTVAETDGAALTIDSVRLSSRHDALALYLTRLIRTLWKAKVIAPSTSPTGVVVHSTVPTAKLVTVQDSLERLRNFLATNAGSIQGLSGPADLQQTRNRHDEIAVQAEHQALHALQRLMESVSEGISFVLMLFDERVADIYARLDDTSRQQLQDLTYESLFSQSSGKELAKLLVKAIVNRNIESGSNVETVANALRRRCGSFCSPDDVVIFKAQEQLQRAAEQVNTPAVARSLLSESLHLFQQVAGNLSFGNLQSAVEQYVELQYYAGAVQLCLAVAREKDRGNTALSWIQEGQPANDLRRAAWEERRRYYDVVHRVLQQLDADSGAEPELVDGRPTLAATKRAEAYHVVNDSDDEVFHFGLYEWYIDQNWTDRLLAIESPHVLTFLQRLASVDVRHAELLCRFYTHRGRFFEAATVQADLANSDFEVGIQDRITLLSRAKGNANVGTAGVGRQVQQKLNHEVTELLEIAHLQDDILERLLADARIPDERKVDIKGALDGKILGLTDLYNGYADQAGYYDLCLLIYHSAEYPHAHLIAETWNHLIEATHHDVTERRRIYQDHRAGRPVPDAVEIPTVAPPQPYEAVSVQVQTIAHRTSLDSLIFPVDALLTALCEYAVTCQQDASIGADPSWPVLLFLQLGVSHAAVVRVLERILDAQAAPLAGRQRRTVVEWINTALEAWLRESERRGLGAGRTETILSAWVVELTERAEQVMEEIFATTAAPAARMEARTVLEASKQRRVAVNRVVAESRQGGLRFR